MKTSGNTILITGGASGIGLALARQFLDLGNTVIITGRDKAKLDAAVKEYPKLTAIQSDVSEAGEIQALYQRVVEKFPDLNVLVNNAGIMRKINLRKNAYDLAGLGAEVEINLLGPMRMIQQFLPQLGSRPAAAIMNVSSGLAFVPYPIAPVYCATKSGLHAYTQSLRIQLNDSPVRVFELCPPLTETPMLGGFEPSDMEGVKAMPVGELARQAIQGMKEDVFEILPGQSKQLRFMSRVAPGFILKMMSRPVRAMLAKAV